MARRWIIEASPERIKQLEKKRLWGQMHRKKFPDLYRERDKKRSKSKKITSRLWIQRLKGKHQFYYKAKIGGRHIAGITALQLATLWHRQKGRCALTGRKLTKSNFQLDHGTPLACGGADGMENLRWVCKEANEAKSALLDKEFIQLCKDVVSFTETSPWR